MNLVENAKIVLTNSFHGSAFSIVLHKPFFHLCTTIDGALQRDDRIDNIIDVLEIQGCNIGINSQVKNELVIDWGVVGRKRHAMRDQSLAFLRNVLV